MPTKRTAPKPSAARTGAAVATRDTLTDKQRMFIEQYFICGLNATEAAMQVYDCKDRTVAQSVGSEVLAKPLVRARVDGRLAEFGLTANEVLARLAQHARGTIEDFIDADSGAIDMKAAKRARQLHLVKKYRTKYTTFTDKDGGESDTLETEIELYDAQAALVHIGKHLGLFQPEVNINNFTMLTDEQLEQLASGKPVQVVSIAAGGVE